jgi:urease accessory protein
VQRCLGISRELAVLGFLRSAYAGMLSAAVRLGRAGPIATQRALCRDRDLLTTQCTRALATDIGDLSSCTPELEIYAMRHETSDTKLFTT